MHHAFTHSPDQPGRNEACEYFKAMMQSKVSFLRMDSGTKGCLVAISSLSVDIRSSPGDAALGYALR